MRKLEDRAGSEPTRMMIMAPVVRSRKGEFTGLFKTLQQKGYNRIRIDGDIFDATTDITLIKTNKHNIEAIIDRITISKTQLRDKTELKRLKSRLNQSIEEALKLADGMAITSWIKDQSFTFPENPKDFEDQLFSEKLACANCGISIEELEPRLFSFNSPPASVPASRPSVR